jgi:hypothetical protein
MVKGIARGLELFVLNGDMGKAVLISRSSAVGLISHAGENHFPWFQIQIIFIYNHRNVSSFHQVRCMRLWQTTFLNDNPLRKHGFPAGDPEAA